MINLIHPKTLKKIQVYKYFYCREDNSVYYHLGKNKDGFRIFLIQSVDNPEDTHYRLYKKDEYCIEEKKIHKKECLDIYQKIKQKLVNTKYHFNNFDDNGNNIDKNDVNLVMNFIKKSRELTKITWKYKSLPKSRYNTRASRRTTRRRFKPLV